MLDKNDLQVLEYLIGLCLEKNLAAPLASEFDRLLTQVEALKTACER